MHAVIMAGGFGTRLRPLTMNIPKPMVPMINKPMMRHIVDLLRRHGFHNIITTLFYQPDVIKNYFGNGKAFDVSIEYVLAEADYGTAGSVRNACGHLKGRFVIISGDVLTDINITEALRFHEERNAQVTIVLSRSKNPLQFGVVITSEDGRITRFLEKPSWGEVFSDTINTGIYIIEPEVLELIPYKQEFDFSKNLFPLMLEKRMGLYGYISDGYWRDVGNLHEYQEAHYDWLSGQIQIEPEGLRAGSVIVGEDTRIETDPGNLKGRLLIGKNTRIGKNARITNSVIGDNCVIESGARVSNCVLWNDVTIGRNAELSFDVIGDQCSVGEGATILDNVFMGDRCVIGKGARLSPNIKLWPEKHVEDGAVLNRSLVWEDRWLRELFSDARVSGLSNIEMNPEFGAKLGAAFGAFLGPGKTVATSRDADNVSRMMNRALMCGLMSAGVNANDLRSMSIPLVRHELSSGREAGGIHVRKSPLDKRMTDIIFFDANGKDLPSSKTKTIERLFFGEDFHRSPPDRVGSINFPERTTEIYREQFLNTLKVEDIRKAKFRIVIDYSNGVASTIFPTIIGAFDCQVVALNAHLDPTKLTRDGKEIDAALRHLSHIVTSLEYDLGCMINAGGERIYIVDENGKPFDDERLLTLVTKLFLHLHPEAKKIAVPITAPAEVEITAKEYGVTVVKTRNSHLAMMEATADKEIRFVGGTKGGFIFTEFFFAADGMFSLAKILEMMARSGWRLGELDAQLPRMFRVRKEVKCPWDLKGKVMRCIMQETESHRRELIDGVRVLFDGDRPSAVSVLLLPDKEAPLFHVVAEGVSPEAAAALAAEFTQRLEQWRDG